MAGDDAAVALEPGDAALDVGPFTTGLALDVVYEGLWQFGRYPVTIYRQPARLILSWVLPFAFITTLPAHALTRGVGLPVLALSLGVGAMAVVLVQFAWNAGLRRYTSATS